MNPTLDLIKNRKSVRVFEDRDLSPQDKKTILRAAVSAPTAGNQQLYTIIDVTDPSLKETLAKTCDNQPFIAQAKLVLIFCADCSKWYQAFKELGAQPRRPGPGDLFLALSDANIAAQTAVLAAQALGIGSCYIGDILERVEDHRALLKLPKYVVPGAMLVFGYPTQGQKDRPKPKRAPLKRILGQNAYPPMDQKAREDLFSYKAGEGSYKAWMEAFCQRKYNSDFAREMSRSAKIYLKDFLEED
ncbi:MAG: nitroreductase family protein [Tissierellia bacterium]|nr:nitroreductase family protein [Tissierellia bacterium]